MHPLRLRRVPALRASHRRRRGRHRPMPARWRGGRAQARAVAAARGEAGEPGQRAVHAAARGRHRRSRLHRLHQVHPGLPGGRDRGGDQAHAHRDRGLVHGLRAVRATLSRGLHRLHRKPGATARGAFARALPVPPDPPRARREGARAAPGGLRMSPAKREELYRRLAEAMPDPKSELEFTTPFELLVAVVLSAQATDKSVNLATAKLFPVANTPQKIAALGVEGLEPYIRTIGLYRGKAKNVVRLAEILVSEHGGEVPRTREQLEALPGVGRKTANVVLNVAFGEPTIAVDTHVFRVSNRTGLAPGKDPLEVETRLLKVTPGKYLRNAHHYLILHGRYTCLARKPLCARCPIFEPCEFKEKKKLAAEMLAAEGTPAKAVLPKGRRV